MVVEASYKLMELYLLKLIENILLNNNKNNNKNNNNNNKLNDNKIILNEQSSSQTRTTTTTKAVDKQQLDMHSNGEHKRFVIYDHSYLELLMNSRLLVNYNKFNLKYTNKSRKTAKRIRYLFSLESKQKPR